ncbi:hypothetical protein SVIO_013390 [Streptomyces violaceusniger]|uniref:Uncharacterized protein n=1 Tax=Streptomyces violaceusniger TaxID=68280 RepID=A0A4D4KV13_STRVO|nr:hypothetical protein SVIO_013390 [Streptomyces violaceusniger]
MQGGQQPAVVDREGGLHQARDTGGGHGVADHRLHRADGGLLPRHVTGAEHLAQRGEFGRVPGGRRGAVRLEQPEGARLARIEARGPPRLPYGTGLTARVGVDQTGGAAVGGHAGAADHRVDAVAVAECVGEPFEDDHTGALADQQAVGRAVEGPDALARRQRAQLGEDAPQGDVVAVVHPAREHHIAPARGQLPHRLVDGDERGGAGGVHGVRGAAQIEPVGDARGGEVGHQADGRLGPVGAEPFGERLPYPVELAGPEVGQQLAEGPYELVGGAHPLVEPDQPGGEIATPAQHHAHPLPVGQPVLAARVGDGRRRDTQGDQLVGFGAGHRVRHDSEPGGLDPGELVDEPAPAAVHPVGRPRRVATAVRGVETGVPPPGRDVADRVHATDQVAPVRVQVGRAGQQHGHPDDGHRRLPVRLLVRHAHQPEAV